MNFGISPAFQYIGTALDWFWPMVAICAAFGLGLMVRC